jgi:hypothetical protein
MARATLGKLCQISLLPLRKNTTTTSSEINAINLLNFILMSPKTHVQYATVKHNNNIIRDQCNQPSELHFDEPKNACTIRDSYEPGCILKPNYYLLHNPPNTPKRH